MWGTLVVGICSLSAGASCVLSWRFSRDAKQERRIAEESARLALRYMSAAVMVSGARDDPLFLRQFLADNDNGGE